MDLKNMTQEELEKLLKDVKKEIDTRNQKIEKVIYICDNRDASNYKLRKYKNWSKVVKEVDTTKTNGYAFVGDFLSIQLENLVDKNSFVVELVDTHNIYLYKAVSDNNKELIFSGSKYNLITFIKKCAELINGAC